MEVTKAVLLTASVQEVWSFLWDVERLASCIPGCSGASSVEPEKRYKAEVSQKVGPFRLKIPLQIVIQEAHAPHRLVALARGQDSRMATNVSVELELHLRPRAAEQTEMAFTAQVDILGKLATLGHAMIKRKADQVMEEFTQNIKTCLDKGGAP